MNKPSVSFAVALLLLLTKVGVAHAADFTVSSSGQGAYVINGQSNPTLTLTRGRTYTFNVVATGHPFWIKTVQETGTGSSFDAGVTNNGASPGTITFSVPANAPTPLYYQCQFHDPMTGTLNLVAAAPSTSVAALTPATSAALGSLLALVGALALLRQVRPRKSA